MDVIPKLPGVDQVIPKSVQTPPGGDGGIQLADRSGRGVARIGEQRLARFLPFFVEGGQRGFGHEDLPAHLQRPCFLNMEGDRRDGDDVLGHVLPHHPIPTGDAVLELAFVVDQAHPKPIDLDFAHVIDDVFVEGFPDFAVEIAHLIFVVDVAQRQHQTLMGDLLELGDDLAPDPLGGAGLELQIGEFPFQHLQFVHRAVEFGIGYGRAVLHVILIVPLLELLG